MHRDEAIVLGSYILLIAFMFHLYVFPENYLDFVDNFIKYTDRFFD